MILFTGEILISGVPSGQVRGELLKEDVGVTFKSTDFKFPPSRMLPSSASHQNLPSHVSHF